MLTNSRMKAARRCARYHRLKYDLGLDAMHRAEPLVFGDAIHRALEPWWLAWRDGDGSDQAPLDAAMEGLASTPDVDAFLMAKAEAMIEGYHAHYAPEMREGMWTVIDAELEFVAPLINPYTDEVHRGFVLGGKLDVLAIYAPDERRHLIEHKSSSEDLTVGSSYWKRLRMDTQVSQYFEGAKHLGEPVDECTYDVLRKPDQKRLKATPREEWKYTQEKSKKCPPCKGAEGNIGCPECRGSGRVVTEPPRLYSSVREKDETVSEYRERCRAAIAEQPAAFYRREPVMRLEEDMRAHRLDTWSTAKLIEQRWSDGYAPRNPDACEQWGRTCEFFQLCSVGQEEPAADDRLYQIRKTVHPELSFVEEPRDRIGNIEEETNGDA